jgi:putative membrane protein
MKVPTLLVISICCAEVALAHGGGAEALRPHNWRELARAWEFDAGVILPLALSAWLYARGVRRLWKATHVGCGVGAFELGCFLGGWLTLFVALVSPLHPWGRVLFSAHMTQHEILMLIAAPLLVLSRPMVVFLKALPGAWAGAAARAANAWWKKTWGVITNALVAWTIHTMTLWVWHIPALFDATVDNDFVHALQHLSFVGSALLFWWAVIHGPRRARSYGVAVLYMFSTALHSGLLGVLLTFATRLWYPAYHGGWGLTTIEDQQLGGLIMWIPAGTVYILAGLILMGGWLRESARLSNVREQALAVRGGV